MLENENFIVSLDVQDTKTTFFFGGADYWPYCLCYFFSFASAALHRQCLLYLSICFITVFGRIIEHMVKVGKADKTRVSELQPTSLD